MPDNLETPDSADELYLARGTECADFQLRPAFTGDLYQLNENVLFTLVQHPCAMRQGVGLSPRQLIALVGPFATPTAWHLGNFKKAFFPEIAGRDLAARFDDMDVLKADDVEGATRVAILSAYGVNLLVQRWIYHCSRVVIPTGRINEQTSGPFEEADLLGEIAQDLVDGGFDPSAAVVQVDRWLGEGDPSMRQRLQSAQFRSTVRRELRAHAMEELQQLS